VIAKPSKPQMKAAPLETPTEPRRLGVLTGEIAVPEDFNRLGAAEVATLFGIEKQSPGKSGSR